jgi:hypothetical protein
MCGLKKDLHLYMYRIQVLQGIATLLPWQLPQADLAATLTSERAFAAF